MGGQWLVRGRRSEKSFARICARIISFLSNSGVNNTGGITSWAAALAAGQAYPLAPEFQLIPGGGLSGLGIPAASPPVPAPALFGMPAGWTFVFIPEPSTIILGVLCAAALLLLRRK